MRTTPLSWRVLFALATVVAIGVASNQPLAAADFPPFEKLPVQPTLPDPLVMLNGQKITSAEDWNTKRRPELKALFQHYMYGFLPAAPTNVDVKVERAEPNYLGGKASKRELVVSFGPPPTPKLNVLLIVPNKATTPVPVFIGMNFCGNHTALDDPNIALPAGWMPKRCPGCGNETATDEGRGKQADVWNVEMIIDRGYALATFYAGDIDPDKPDFKDGVHPHFMKPGQNELGPHDWGTIAAWAFGYHRVVDALLQDKKIDSKRIAAVGHSRNGKTALLAAALDERITLAIPSQAGCGGTAPSRGTVGESVKRINTSFPHWFCDEFTKFNDEPARLPFDQHCLVALCAPRPVLFCNAVEDTWANPDGQFEVLQAADPVYRLLQAGGLEAKQRPELGQLVDSKLGYFIRAGKHSMTKEDWNAYLNFADKQWGKSQ